VCTWNIERGYKLEEVRSAVHSLALKKRSAAHSLAFESFIERCRAQVGAHLTLMLIIIAMRSLKRESNAGDES
jgi:hypothetical protein